MGEGNGGTVSFPEPPNHHGGYRLDRRSGGRTLAGGEFPQAGTVDVYRSLHLAGVVLCAGHRRA